MGSKAKTIKNSIKDKRVKNLIVFLISLILVFGVGFIVFNYVPFFSKYDNYVISSGSMDPVLKIGDLVYVDTSVKAEDIETGKIIAFYQDIDEDGADEIVVHYLDSVVEINGVDYYKTRHEVDPDNPDASTVDSWTLSANDIIGLEVMKIPRIGPLVMFAQSPYGRATIIIDVIVIYALIEYYNSGKKDQKKPEELNIDEKKDTA